MNNKAAQAALTADTKA